jgi:hypothetical protein
MRLHLDLVKKEDIAEVCKLAKETNYFFPGGMGSQILFLAVCKDALHRNDVIIAVAKLDNVVVGYSVKIIHRSRYWKSFIFRYPVLGVKLLSKMSCKRITGFFQAKHQPVKQSIKDLVNIVPTNRSWRDSSPTIAKAEHTAVSKDARGRSIGLKLHFYTFKILKERGVTRVDNTIDFDNISSIRMNRKAGWRFSLTDNYLFGTIDLAKTSEFDQRSRAWLNLN